MAAGRHFGCPKITLHRISYHFRSIPQFLFLWIFFTKWLPAPILDVRNSLSIAFLAISDEYETFFKFVFLWFFYKMAAGSHFGCPKITFGHISGNFRSIRNFFWNFWQNGCRRPFKINADFNFFFKFFLQNGGWWPSWMSEIHFRSHFWPFQIDMEIFWCPKFNLDRISGHFRSIGHFGFLKFTFNGISDPYGTFFFSFLTKWPSAFWMSANNFWSHSGHFRSIRFFFDKMATGGHFGWDDNVNYWTRPRYLDHWMSNHAGVQVWRT